MKSATTKSFLRVTLNATIALAFAALPRTRNSYADQIPDAKDEALSATRIRPRRHPRQTYITDKHWGLFVLHYTGKGEPAPTAK